MPNKHPDQHPHHQPEYQPSLAPQQHPSHHAQIPKLNRVSGQVDAIKRMISDQRYCVDIITQLKAARSALKSIELTILSTHMRQCLDSACQQDANDVQQKIEELIILLKKYE
ncbi:metal-sensitive transcriptional regulator [Ostreibacterium oceani]|uniref:Metal-sensing transcriptional repressor n=1 Tax=Ostreibacterium oceani TaxID=2654998 RepID=A0A6N7F0V0_9GAMM|nr:metal-sensitive transcriptional regulator [Ostreibacterium oceani]MPV85476.1 metal-sensing transcriptional repressor [Ostreibacterium oceani]